MPSLFLLHSFSFNLKEGKKIKFWDTIPPWIIGVILALLSAFFCNLGVNLQKRSHNNNSDREVKKKWTQSRTWILGLVLIFIGSVADFFAFGFAPQSLVAPLSLTTLVSNTLLSAYFLGEKLGVHDILAVALLIGGCAVVVVFGPHSDSLRTAKQLQHLYIEPPFLIYASIATMLIVILYFYVRRCDKIREEYGADSPTYAMIAKTHRFLYSAIAGSMGAQNVLFAKAASESLLELFIFGRWTLFTQVGTYFTVIMLGFTIHTQLKWLNQALELFDSAYVIPVFEAFWVSLAVVGGLVMYKETSLLRVPKVYFFVVGLSLAIAGLVVLARRPVNGASNSESVYSRLDGEEQSALSADAENVQVIHRNTNQDVSELMGDDSMAMGDLSTTEKETIRDLVDNDEEKTHRVQV